jgi:aryl-alcohol dehydrogenase-like predicted oxidoreductase
LEVPIEETLSALVTLVKAGKVGEIGCSNFSGPQIDQAAAVSEDNGVARFVSAQNYFNVLHQDPLGDVVEIALARSYPLQVDAPMDFRFAVLY